MDLPDDAPVHEPAEVRAGVAPGDPELGHDLVGVERLRRDEQEPVDAGHGAVDAPVGPEPPPALDELGPGFGEAHVVSNFQKLLKIQFVLSGQV